MLKKRVPIINIYWFNDKISLSSLIMIKVYLIKFIMHVGIEQLYPFIFGIYVAISLRGVTLYKPILDQHEPV